MFKGALPGFRDFYPQELAERAFIMNTWRDVARRYAFVEYDGPPLEPLDLYTRKSGDEIVGQLYAFTDKGVRSAQAPLVAREAVEALIVMLSPFAPHTSEELWQIYGHNEGLAKATWPIFDAAVAKAEELEIPVQVNGKLRGRVVVAPDITDADLEKIALADPNVQTHTAGKTIRKVVIAKGRLVSVVVA